jgi:hypothetical protein
MKKFFILILVLFSFEAYTQRSFIGQTKKQVREFWELHISINYFHEGTYDNGEAYFDIMAGNIGAPTFSATFDKETGKCYKHDQEISFDDISVMQARLKKAGFTYQKDRWVNPQKIIIGKFPKEVVHSFYHVAKNKTSLIQ